MNLHEQLVQDMDEHVHDDDCPCGCCPAHLVECKLSDKEVRGEVWYVYSEDDDDEAIGAEPDSLLDDADEEREFIFRQKHKEGTFHRTLDCARDRKDWHDLYLQLNHAACCWKNDPDRLELLNAIEHKVTYVRKDGQPGYFNNKAKWDGYDMLGPLLACSSYEKRDAFCRCGCSRNDGMRSSCNDVLFCPRCGYHRRTKPMLAEFGGHFSADLQVFLVTFMPVHEVDHAARLTYRDFQRSDWKRIAKQGLAGPFQHYGLDYEDAALDCSVYAEIFRRVIQQAIDKGYITGAIGSFEIALRFLPLGILPHCHLIVFSRGFCLEYAQEMRRWFKQHIRNSRRLESKLHPDVSVLQLRESNDYRRALAYCFKRIKIEQAYAYAAEKVDFEKGRMELLNIEVNRVFDTLGHVKWEIENPVYRYGICNPLKRGYCFTVTAERKKKRKAEAKLRKEKKQREEAEARELGAPLRRRRSKTKKESRQRRSEKAEYTKFIGEGSETQPAVKPQQNCRRRKAVTRKQSTATVGPDNSVDASTSPAPIKQGTGQAVESEASASSDEQKERLRAAIRKFRERERAVSPQMAATPISPPAQLFVYETSSTPTLASHDDPSSYLDEY